MLAASTLFFFFLEKKKETAGGDRKKKKREGEERKERERGKRKRGDNDMSQVGATNGAAVQWVRSAVRMATDAVRRNQPGLFTALVVDGDGRVLATGHNEVLAQCDPTAHAEVMAIRRACQERRTPSLEGAALYCNAEPCPMCLAAAYWAGIGAIYYACPKEQVAAIVGFDDARLYRDLALAPNDRVLLRTVHVDPVGDDPTEAFVLWKERETASPTAASTVSPSARAAVLPNGDGSLTSVE